MAKKSKSIKVRLVSPTGSFYTTTKNPKMAHKLELRKFDNKTRDHQLFVEKKIK